MPSRAGAFGDHGLDLDDVVDPGRLEERHVDVADGEGQPLAMSAVVELGMAVALVERGGNVRSFQVENADKAAIDNIIREIIREARVFTDESRLYGDEDKHAVSHEP